MRVMAPSIRPCTAWNCGATSESEMTASENNRRARIYTITPAGRRRLSAEEKSWHAFTVSVRRVLENE